MGKQHQVGYAVYMDQETEANSGMINSHQTVLGYRLRLIARARRLTPPTDIRFIVRPGNPMPFDPLDAIGTFGAKGFCERLPWHKGWLDAVKARFQLWRLAVSYA